MRKMTGRAGGTAWFFAIAVIAAFLGVAVSWRIPALDRYAGDWLTQARGPLEPPDDIAIVAIDEASIRRFGRFPWPRRIMAQALDGIARGGPRVIALDVLYSDPGDPEDDQALASAIARASNVVAAAQLIEDPERPGAARWLLPLTSIGAAAAAIGHVNVQTEAEGVARRLQVRGADDAGKTLNAMAVEVVRLGDGLKPEVVFDSRGALEIGERSIPVEASPPAVILAPISAGSGAAVRLTGGRMTIDYIGPPGAFLRDTVSLSDVIAGSVPPARFRDKYVLIGATAAALGDRLASPFGHHSDSRGNQHGALMPGVEVLANAVDTILESRFYSKVSGWAEFFWALLAAAATLMLLEAAQGGREFLKESAVLAGLAGASILAGYLAYTRLMVVPPLTAVLVSLACAGVLGLMRRSLATNIRLDAGLAELVESEHVLELAPDAGPANRAMAPTRSESRFRFPRGLEWKARMLGELNARLVGRARFIDMALGSVQDGLLIASPDGRITWANRAAAAILDTTPRALAGEALLELLLESPESDLLTKVLIDGGHIEREISIRGVRPRRFILRMAAVASGAAGEGKPLGIVASLSDVTRHHELQKTKNDVMAFVSHEMRTPLTAIQGMTELLATYEVDPERRREMHEAINGEVKRLARMITEYLDITRLESGATAPRKAPVRVDTLVERVLLLLEPVAAQRGIRLERRFAPGLPGAMADPDLLSRAIENLVSNAVKYSPNGTTVRVSAEADDFNLRIEVADQGHGIPESDLSRIFEKFYRVPRIQDADVPGTGLGLPLVREIAELHQGSVTVRSEVNGGSTFTLRIPLDAAGEARNESAGTTA